MRDRRWYRRSGCAVVLVLLVSACATTPPTPPTSIGAAPPAPSAEGRRGGTLTMAIINSVPGMAPIGTSSSTSGGFPSAAELHSAPLISSEEQSRQPVGRLAARVPSLENGDIALLPDGRMRVTYSLRPGVTWHDGTPFTADDLVFAFRFMTEPGIPFIAEEPIRSIQTVEAPDDHTFVTYFPHPYYQPQLLGLPRLWPLPRHILMPAYERYLATKNVEEVVNLPYWTSEYVHLGPFRLAAFDPADTIVLQANDAYFLGRPRLDTIRIKIFTDPNTLYANLLSGTVDVFLENTLPSNLGFDLQERWQQTGEGTVYLRRSAQRSLYPQFRSSIQVEPAMLDVRVRAALYHALDREALSEGLQNGHRELAAYDILAPGELLHDATRDALRRYAYDPERARALLRDVGWMSGSDGLLRNPEGRTLRAPITATSGRTGEQELAAIAHYWRQIGVDVEERVIPAAQVRNAEYRATYPGWEASASAGGDEILGRLEGPPASAQNRWLGNRGGYENPRAQELIDRYRSSLAVDAQFQAMKAISDLVVDELPFLVLYSTAVHIGASSRVQALDDQAGGDSAGRNYGTYSRNGHLWQLR